jgi:hypothetical protein
MPSPQDRKSFISLVVVLLVVGGCGGRGPKKTDGGLDASPTSDAADGAPADVAPERADGAPDLRDGAVERVDATDTTVGIDATEPEPICVDNLMQSPICGRSKCGNGVRDICLVTSCRDGTVYSPKEPCDGTDVAGSTCVADGWGSGAVTCSSTCTLVKTACSVCTPLDATLVACNPTPFPAQRADEVHLAATDTSVALAWSALPVPNRLTLSLTRLSPTLDVVGVTTLEDVTFSSGLVGSFASISIAPFGAGWIVGAIVDQEKVIFHVVDETGRDLGRVVLDTLSDDGMSSRFVTIVARPTGGAMAIWSGKNTIRSATISTDGIVVARPPLSLAALVNVFPSNAVWFGDAAYLVHTASDEASLTINRTVLVRFPTDGTPPQSVTLFNELGAPQVLGADADELLLLHRGRLPGGGDDSGGLLLMRFDAKGVAKAQPLVLPSQRPAALLSAGDDALVVGAEDAGRSFGIERWARSGAVVTPSREVGRFPSSSPVVYATAARRGSEIVAAWSDVRSGANSIGLARLAQ